MSRLGLLGLVGTALAVLVLVGSMVEGLVPGDAAPGAHPADVEPADEERRRIRVEVLNAAGIDGLANAATDSIRAAGYDVVYYGNASSFGRDTSVVLDRSGRLDAARAVAAVVGVPRVLQRPDTTLYLDVTVIIGTDWSGVPAVADSTPR